MYGFLSLSKANVVRVGQAYIAGAWPHPQVERVTVVLIITTN